ncbi:TlpA disulfide reductase family protein [Pedobacter aquatilis]|uniref:TlpA family protein disulfide reductase n=1 Tax=Pedobacter aquatilis TaxID=351343 RepID=UPI002931ECCE|nr:TlpA disulfide reductase family protein [Pedobacter aquatilis]
MKNLFSILSFFLLWIPASKAQIPFEIELQSKSLKNSKFIFCVLANNKIEVLKKYDISYKNGYVKMRGSLDQQARFVSLSTQHNGQTAFKIFSIDGGKNSVTVELKMKNNAPQLVVLTNAQSNQISELIDTAFYENLAMYRQSSGLKMAHTLDTAFNNKFKDAVLRIIASNPQNYGSLLALSGISKIENSPQWAERILTAMDTLSPNIKSTSLFKQIATSRKGLIAGVRNSSAGQTAKIFEIKDEKSQVFSNKNLLGQNYLLAFSATWCIPCQHQLPLLKKIYAAYKQAGLKVVYFNDDDNIEKWQHHIKDNELDWINVSDRKKPGQSIVQKSFGINAVPTILIVNSEGKIVYNSDQTDPGLNTLESNIKSLYSNLK